MWTYVGGPSVQLGDRISFTLGDGVRLPAVVKDIRSDGRSVFGVPDDGAEERLDGICLDTAQGVMTFECVDSTMILVQRG